MRTKPAAFLVLSLLLSVAANAGAGPGHTRGDEEPPADRNYVLHEWGTFTTIAGADGKPVEWKPFSGNTELPPFVRLASALQSGHLDTRATVRMETPVIYFYAKEALKVDVRVGMPGGSITEWFPPALEHQGGIAWNGVRIVPGSKKALPPTTPQSRSFAARATDATPIVVGDDAEKFLFYRGLGSPALDLDVTLDDGGLVHAGGVRGNVIVFERSGKRVGFDVGEGAVQRPKLSKSASLAGVEAALKAELLSRGLYEKEADAMLATWRTSWFEEGLRVFWFLERERIDAMLPLSVSPKPSESVRVIVGRAEVFTPEMMRSVAKAGDAGAYGRFAEPLLRRVCATQQIAACTVPR